MTKFSIPEKEIARMQMDAMKAINAAIAEVLADEWESIEPDGSNLRHLIGSKLRLFGREFCERVENGEYQNASR